MKPASHPWPSGDRLMARLLVDALGLAEHSVEHASRFRSYDGAGDPSRQRRIAAIGEQLAVRLLRRYKARPRHERPQVWFTYHLYHKAPDWLGPRLSRELGIPYVVAEASYAPKQRRGPWAGGHEAAASAIADADLIFGLNRADSECILPLLADPARFVPLKPFIDVKPYAAAAARRQRHREALMGAHGLAPETPLLVTAAMMRPGDKLASYRILGDALARLKSSPWQLMVAGDGPARSNVETALAPLGRRVTWLGALAPNALAGLYAACDIYVWPAVNEAWGMAFLEAQAAGLPVVAGRAGGVADVVADGESGHLVAPGNPLALAGALKNLLDHPEIRTALGHAARDRVTRDHDIGGAATVLGGALEMLVTGDRAGP